MEGQTHGGEGLKDHSPSLWSGRTGSPSFWANAQQGQESGPFPHCVICQWLPARTQELERDGQTERRREDRHEKAGPRRAGFWCRLTGTVRVHSGFREGWEAGVAEAGAAPEGHPSAHSQPSGFQASQVC